MDILAVRDFAISEPLQEVQWMVHVSGNLVSLTGTRRFESRNLAQIINKVLGEKRKGTVLRKGDRDLSGEGYGYLNGEDGGGIFPRTGEMRSNGNSERRGKEVLDSLSDFDRDCRTVSQGQSPNNLCIRAHWDPWWAWRHKRPWPRIRSNNGYSRTTAIEVWTGGQTRFNIVVRELSERVFGIASSQMVSTMIK
ncbi:uncharacterized protein CIMG_06853 [Coccidioides immitis RS]|uniref:Uncharacterized protein n=1 Tax=Coccidioides immitis (strain RS) TaxID=246410 RepID=J3K928_COCIM|nr:uncharacterized protein CIMG_06853 [Coccidioides immitis RS]EAS31374.3 hypothetical protein CIMG_06853 [Coccidioides immitis RS]